MTAMLRRKRRGRNAKKPLVALHVHVPISSMVLRLETRTFTFLYSTVEPLKTLPVCIHLFRESLRTPCFGAGEQWLFLFFPAKSTGSFCKLRGLLRTAFEPIKAGTSPTTVRCTVRRLRIQEPVMLHVSPN